MLKLLRLLVILGSITFAIAQDNAGYDAAQAKEYWYISSASYCRMSKINDWTCGKACSVPRPLDITPFYNKSGSVSGFSAYNPARNQIFVVFRGTVPWLIKNWVDDIEFVKINYPLCNNGCQVHRGFWYSYLEVHDQVLQGVNKLRAKYPQAEILLTGHSLGGGLATHALLYLQNSGIKVSHFITFGSPRTGDKNFSDYLKRTYTGFKQRVTHARDPVPHLPFYGWGFNHLNTEIYYANIFTPYKVCSDDSNEDPYCSKQHLANLLTIDDHVHYFDLDQIIHTPLCQ